MLHIIHSAVITAKVIIRFSCYLKQIFCYNYSNGKENDPFN